MESRIMPLAEVQFRHGYFRSGVCASLSVSPVDASLRVMNNHGLWWKAKAGGFLLGFDVRHAGNSRTRDDVFGERIALRFLVRLRDPYFYNYTVGPAPAAGKEIYCFFNRGGSGLLHAGAAVSAADLVRIGVRGAPVGVDAVPFAILGLRLRRGMPEVYTIEFQPRSSTWQYILVGKQLQELQRPAVINSLTKEAFRGPEDVRLVDGRHGLAFVSPDPIGCSEWPGSVCMLVEGWDGGASRYKVVMPALPVPDMRMISRGVSGAATDYSEIFIY